MAVEVFELAGYRNMCSYGSQYWGSIPDMDTYTFSVTPSRLVLLPTKLPILPGRAGTAKCEGDLKSNYHQTKESVEHCHHSPMHVYSVILGLKHRNGCNS